MKHRHDSGQRQRIVRTQGADHRQEAERWIPAMASSMSAFTLTRPTIGRRPLRTVAGGIILAAATVGAATISVANLVAAPPKPFAVDRTLVAQEQLRQHVLRENDATPAEAGSILRQHVLRENDATPTS